MNAKIIFSLRFALLICLNNLNNLSASVNAEDIVANNTGLLAEYESTTSLLFTPSNSKSEDNEEESEDMSNVCSVKDFISNLNCTQYMPDDYEEVKQEEIKFTVSTISETFAIFNRLQKWRMKLMDNKDLTDSVKVVASRLFELVYEAKLPPECSASLIKIATKSHEHERWALKFIDSMGNLVPSGLLEGRMASLGEYDQCVEIVSPPDNSTTIYGQYCQLKFTIPYPSQESYRVEDERFSIRDGDVVYNYLKEIDLHVFLRNKPIIKPMIETLNILHGSVFKLGICIPHTCRPIDIENAINKVVYPVTKIPVSVPELTCVSKQKHVPMDIFQKVTIATFSTLFILVILSTIYELCATYYPKTQTLYEPNSSVKIGCKNTMEKVILSFSVITNTKKLLEVPKFPAIYGIRLFLTYAYYSIMAYLFPLATLSQKFVLSSVPLHLIYYGRYFFFRTPILWIDALICCFGLLMTHTILGKLERFKGNFNYGSFIWQRWIRVTIALSGSILITYIVPLLGDGPVWQQQQLVFQTACRSLVGLFGTLFSYNNYMFAIYDYKLEIACPVCNPPTWYFSTSFQIYIFAPIVFLSLYKRPKFGVILNLAVIIIGTLLTLYPKFIYDYINYNDAKRYESIKQMVIHITAYYLSPFQYIGNFSLGMFTGYMLYKHPNIYLGGKKVELLLWIIGVSIIPIIYIWNNTFWSLLDSPSEVSILIWYSFGRTLWGLAFAWFYFACATGRGGFVERFFSWRVLQPIAKLNYTIYILQVPVLTYRIYRTRNSYIMTDSQLFQDMYVDLTLITILAYLFYLVFERPLLNLLDMMSSKDNWSEYDNREMYGSSYYNKNLVDQNILKSHILPNGKKDAGNVEISAISTSDSSENSSLNNGSNERANII